jgi:hypothetical protein
MGTDNATSDTPFGLVPYECVLGVHWYAIVTSNAVAMAIGDMVESVGEAVTTPLFGYLQKVITEETGAAGTIVGAVASLLDSDGFPVERIAVTTTGNSTIAGYAAVYDHPDQRYIIKEDGDSSSVVVANIGLNADAVSTHAAVAGNSYKSKMELDSSTVANTATLALRILGIHPDDTIASSSAAGTHCRFIVKINPSYAGDITGA